MKTLTRFDSKVFKAVERRQAVANFVGRQAKDFKNLTRRRMIESRGAGRLYQRKRGEGFRRAHRASRKGQRPTVDTGTLVQAVSDRRVTEFASEVYIAPKTNPQSGAAADKYAEILQTRRGRKIITDRDAGEAGRKMARDGGKLVASLMT